VKLAELDLDRLVADIRAIAEEHPHHAVEECTYFGNVVHTPNCIVGNALARQGITYDDLHEITRNGVILAPNSARFDSIAADLGIEHDDPQVRWIRRVQAWQDTRVSWAVSVHEADEGNQPSRRPL
jgi:hypothetical protein